MSTRFVRIQIRIFLAFGAAMALFLAGGGWAANRVFEAGLRRQVEAQQVAFVSLLAEAMDDKITTYREGLVAAAREAPTASFRNRQALARWLGERAGLHALFEGELCILDSEGRALAGRQPEPLEVYRGLARKATRTGEVALGQVPPPNPGDVHALGLAAPVRGPAGPPQAVLAGTLSISHDDFLGTLARERLPGGGAIQLRDGDGQTLFAAQPAGRAVETRGALVTERRLASLPWTLSARTPGSYLQAPLAKVRHVLQAASALAVLLSLLLAWGLSHRLTQNLEAFTRQVEGAADRPVGQRAIPGRTRDETHLLVDAFNDLMARLDGKTTDLLQAQARSEEELALAKHVLHRLVAPGLAVLPPTFHMETLRTERINGDACTYRPGPDGLHFGLLCDATGHGLTAGISTLPAVQAFLSMAARDIPLETAYLEINRHIHQLMPVGRFLCLLLVRHEPRSGTLEVLNAGLPDALLCLPGAGRQRLPSRNLPAGILADPGAPVADRLEVPPGARLLAFTDGVQDLFPGDEVSRRLVEGLLDCPFEVHRDAVRETLALAIRNQEQHDDASWALWELPAPPGKPV